MENNKKILVEKEIYGWNINDIAKITIEEFLPRLPENVKSLFDGYESEKDYVPAESYVFMEEEIFADETPEFVKEYNKDGDAEFMTHSTGFELETGDYITLNVVTTFQPRDERLPEMDNKDGRDHDNRLILIDVRNECGEVIFEVDFVK